jgi:hypothetical protein
MTPGPYFVAGAVFATISVIVYVVRVAQKGRSTSLKGFLQLLLSGFGIATGIRVCVIAGTANDLGPFGEGDRVLILIGGAAMFYLCCETIWRHWRDPEPPDSET